MENLEPIHLSLEEMNDLAMAESWHPTPYFRWRKTGKITGDKRGTTHEVELEQMWQGSKGNQKWEEIEIVE